MVILVIINVCFTHTHTISHIHTITPLTPLTNTIHYLTNTSYISLIHSLILSLSHILYAPSHYLTTTPTLNYFHTPHIHIFTPSHCYSLSLPLPPRPLHYSTHIHIPVYHQSMLQYIYTDTLMYPFIEAKPNSTPINYIPTPNCVYRSAIDIPLIDTS